MSEKLLRLFNKRKGFEGTLELLVDVLDEVSKESKSLFVVLLSDEVGFVFSVSLINSELLLSVVHFVSRFEFREVLSGRLEGSFANSSGGLGLGEGGFSSSEFLLSEGGFFFALLHHFVGDFLMFSLVSLELGHHVSDLLEEVLDGLGVFSFLDFE